MIMQGMIDYCGLFMDVYSGCPGKVHAWVLVNSSFHHKGMSSTLVLDWKWNIYVLQVWPHVHAGNGFLKCIHLPVGAIGCIGRPCLSCSTMADETLQKRQHWQLMVRKHATSTIVEWEWCWKMLLVGWMVGRWWCLLKWLEFKLENIPLVTVYAVSMTCEVFRDLCHTEWVEQTPRHFNSPYYNHHLQCYNHSRCYHATFFNEHLPFITV